MDNIEITGKNLEEAKQLAAEELGVPVEEMQYEVLDESAKGFLGLGQTRVRLRAWLAGAAPPEEQSPAAPAEQAPSTSSGLAQELLEIVRQVLAAMQIQVQPELREATSEEIHINLTGPDVAILIGKHGQTLDALQYLMGIAINKKHYNRIRVILDAEGYRDRHREILENRAREFAERVKATGQEAVLDPLPARDRRIIHTYLADNPDVTTYSEGQGEDRRLVITPRK